MAVKQREREMLLSHLADLTRLQEDLKPVLGDAAMLDGRLRIRTMMDGEIVRCEVNHQSRTRLARASILSGELERAVCNYTLRKHQGTMTEYPSADGHHFVLRLPAFRPKG